MRIPLLLGPEHPCHYLPGLTARSAFVPHELSMNPHVYGALLRQGFRRSGSTVYRPRCPDCQACIPLRVPVATFQPDRSQRRLWKMNSNLEVRELPAQYDAAHYALFCRYQAWRYPQGTMGAMSANEYFEFLASSWSDARLVQFGLEGRLAAVAVVDRTDDGLSAVYTFYEPDLAKRGPGTCAVLWQIRRARALGLDYVYLGYWIAACREMAYKSRYRPFEILQGTAWRGGDGNE